MAHAKLARSYVSVELEDGSIHEDVRILFTDLSAYMKAARINNWDLEDGTLRAVFTLWHAGKREGRWEFTFEDMRDKHLIDMSSEEVPVDQDTTQDPTPAS